MAGEGSSYPLDKGPTRVVADSLRFRQRLHIGEEAFAFLRTKKRVGEIWDTAGAAATGAGIASSSVVAGTFFAPTGLMASLGLAGAAVTPVGWVVAAAVVAGGGYYGLARLMHSGASSLTDTIPKFINTPIDILGAALFSFLGALSVRVSAIDGEVNQGELDVMREHFVREWGFDEAYTEATLGVLVTNAGSIRVKQVARELAQFLDANPDCNPSSMQGELMQFLRELAMVDGAIDEREELALAAVEATFLQERRLSLGKANRAVRGWSNEVGEKVAFALSGTGAVLGRVARRARKLFRRERSGDSNPA